ncbi:MAG TPA: hypothetical protein VGR02_12220 [Thermoanaerobaculia bacterium]|jgi:hypothetical protein|nr:hypothetical protein [Thermoanaerobaculia bacterium]
MKLTVFTGAAFVALLFLAMSARADCSITSSRTVVTTTTYSDGSKSVSITTYVTWSCSSESGPPETSIGVYQTNTGRDGSQDWWYAIGGNTVGGGAGAGPGPTAPRKEMWAEDPGF